MEAIGVDFCLDVHGDEGTPRPGRESHSDTTLHISLVILHTKYTGWREDECNVYA